jgi:hypothetical protein
VALAMMTPKRNAVATVNALIIADLNAKLQSYAEQHLAAALEFAHKLSLAKDFQDLARIQAEFFQNRMQSLAEQTKDLAEAYTKSAASAIKGISVCPLNKTTSLEPSGYAPLSRAQPWW